jgi:hypothetical protein
VYTPWLLYKPLEIYYYILDFSLTDSLTTQSLSWWPKENNMCRMLQDPATLRGDVWYKGKTTTTMTAMKMEYGDETELNLQDSIGLSLVTHQCHVMSTQMSLLWNSIHWGMIRLPRDTWSLHTDEYTMTGCTLPPFARNRAGITRDAYSEDNEELIFNSKCANIRNLQSTTWNWHT